MTATPRRPPRAALAIAAILAAVGAVMLWDAAGLRQDGGYAGVGPADVPRLVAFGLIGLAVWTVVAALRGDTVAPEPQRAGPVLWVLGGLVGQLALLQVAGFSIATGFLFAMTARGFGERRLPLALGIGIALAFAVYIVFDQVLRLNLPAGPLERLVTG